MTYLTIEICGEENGKLTIKERVSKRHWDEPCLCEPITSKQIVDHWTPELDDWKKAVNVAYIDSVWVTLKPDGIWGYPEIAETFRKMEDGKWLLQGYEDVHSDVRTTLHVDGFRVVSDGKIRYVRKLL